MNTTFKPIGYLESPFKEKFGIPRQAGLAPEARAVVRLDPAMRDGLQGLEGFSHVWILFVFHGHENDDGKLLVRPPRLGGTRKMGVFATRSPHRPNPIGLSLVRLEGVEPDESSPAIHVSGVDFLDGTPVLDIKPYLPGGDIARGEVRTGWLEKAPEWPALEASGSKSKLPARGGPYLRAPRFKGGLSRSGSAHHPDPRPGSPPRFPARRRRPVRRPGHGLRRALENAGHAVPGYRDPGPQDALSA